jgi:hypothetical protein
MTTCRFLNTYLRTWANNRSDLGRCAPRRHELSAITHACICVYLCAGESRQQCVLLHPHLPGEVPSIRHAFHDVRHGWTRRRETSSYWSDCCSPLRFLDSYLADFRWRHQPDPNTNLHSAIIWRRSGNENRHGSKSWNGIRIESSTRACSRRVGSIRWYVHQWLELEQHGSRKKARR